MKELKFKAYASVKQYEEQGTEPGKGVIKFSGWATRLTNPETGQVEADRDMETVTYDSVKLQAKVLLAQHDSDRFIGTVRMEKRLDGIWFEAFAHEYLDPKVYYGLKEKILDSVSIGFKISDWEVKELNGEEIVELKADSIYELSVVSIPANRHATIQSNLDQVKSIVKDGKCTGLSCSLKSLKEMNPDCGCPIEASKEKSLEKDHTKKVITYNAAHGTDYPVSDDETWDGASEVAKASVDDLKVMCAYVEEGREDVEAGYKLPHHKADGYAVVLNGVQAAIQRLYQTDMPEDERKGVYDHLAKHSRDDFSIDPIPFEDLKKAFENGTEIKGKKMVIKNTETEPKEEQPVEETPVDTEEKPTEEVQEEPTTETETTTEEAPKEPVEEPKKEEAPVETPIETKPTEEAPKEEPKKEEAVPEKEPEPVSTIQELVGKLSVIDINDMEDSNEVDALLTQIFRIRDDAEKIAEQLAELESENKN